MLPEGTQWITDETERIQPGDLMRVRDDERSHYGPWQSADHLGGSQVGHFPAWHSRDLQFCRPVQPAAKPAPEQPPTATTDRGERYRRRIYQSIDGPNKGKSIIVDLADVLHAFGVPYMLGQAVKKSIIPGDRGAKDRLKDLREAAWHIQRQIQIEEARQQEQADL